MKPMLIAAILLALAGCTVSQGHWGNYSNELYTYYKNNTPQERLELEQTLLAVFESAERKGINPPPGLYAEYGTLMLNQGNHPQAIAYYQKERSAWPESEVLMTALIGTLEKQSNATDVSGQP